MRRLTLLLGATIFAATFSIFAYAQPEDPNTLIAEGNKFFQSSEYDKAASHYRKALKLGAYNSGLLYNLGNTEFRLKNIGNAIAYYRLALAESPNDPNIKSNLQFVLEKNTPTVIPSHQSSYPAGVLGLRALLSADKVKLLFLLSNCLLWLALCASIKYNGKLISIYTVAAALTFVYLGAAAFFVRSAATGDLVLAISAASRTLRPAVVINKEGAKVFAGDGEQFQVIYKMPEGTQVELETRKGDWSEVQLPEQRKGWVNTKDLIVINS